MSRRAEGLARLAKAATPTAVGLAGVVLLALPVRLFGGSVPTPMLPLLVVFFWAIYGPAFMPAASVFMIGLLQDFLTGGPLGLWPAVYLFTQYIVASQRSYFAGRETQVVWTGFAFATLFAAIIVWLVMSLMSGAALRPDALFYQAVVTALIYPAVAALFGRVHSRMLLES